MLAIMRKCELSILKNLACPLLKVAFCTVAVLGCLDALTLEL